MVGEKRQRRGQETPVSISGGIINVTNGGGRAAEGQNPQNHGGESSSPSPSRQRRGGEGAAFPRAEGGGAGNAEGGMCLSGSMLWRRRLQRSMAQINQLQRAATAGESVQEGTTIAEDGAARKLISHEERRRPESPGKRAQQKPRKAPPKNRAVAKGDSRRVRARGPDDSRGRRRRR
jgi:hypothetical protein